MAESKTIERRSADSDPHGFTNLRREGIRLAQDLSGELWTDYNLHDPGVTILEQLCYTITELIYRTEFDIADHLTDERGSIDYQAQALHRPELAFCCRPTTVDDYRKALLDAVPEIDNAWLAPAEGPAEQGLHHIDVRLAAHHTRSNGLLAEVKDKVNRVYTANRSLCEDVHEITILDNDNCELCGRIEVDRGRSPNEILADIYYACARRIDGGVHLYAFDDECNDGKSLEEIFTGPLTAHGVFKSGELAEPRGEVQIADLFSLINAVPGVDRILELSLERNGESYYDSAKARPGAALQLQIPAADHELRLELTSRGRVIPVSVRAVRRHFDERNYRYRTLRHTRQNVTALYTLPKGEHRALAPYYSIQNQFPAIYGVNQFGVPNAADDDVKARAAQLKAYLLLFEQLMANYTAHLAGVRSLFSIEHSDGPTYVHQALTSDSVQGLERVYPQEAEQAIGGILAHYDNRHDRRSRMLDHLLALYGERFSQHSLRTFDVYHSGEDREQAIIENKLKFLKAVVALGRDRAGGLDYNAHAWETGTAGGMHRRVSVLLGCDGTSRALCSAIEDQSLRLVSHADYQRLRDTTSELLDFDGVDDATRAGFEPLPREPALSAASLDELRVRLEGVVALREGLLSESLLRAGIGRDAYRLSRITPDGGHRLVLENHADRQWWYLAEYGDRQEAVDAAYALQKYLIGLNTGCEGLHIIEHLLLRPVSDHDSPSPEGVDDDFYSHRITAVFPAWTARCNERRFRHLAEETVRINCPAHVHADFRWFDFDRMSEFERYYRQWLDAKSQAGAMPGVVDDTASELQRLLQQSTMPGGSVL